MFTGEEKYIMDSTSLTKDIQPEVLEKVVLYLKSLGLPTKTSAETRVSDTNPIIFSLQDIDPLSLKYLADYVQNANAFKDTFENHDDDDVNERNPLPEDDSQQGHQLHSLPESSIVDTKPTIDSDKVSYVKHLLSQLSEEEMQRLSPLEKILVDELYNQNQKIVMLQGQIDIISKGLFVESKSNDAVKSPSPDGERELQENIELGGENIGARALPLLNSLFHKIMYLPWNIYHSLTNSRLFHLFELIYQEAADFRVPGNPNARFFDIHLMVKIAFSCIFLNARMHYSSRSSNIPDGILGDMIRIWKTHRTSLLIASGISVYFIQSGLASFLLHITYKENIIRRAWKKNNDIDSPQSYSDHNRRRHRGRRDRTPVFDPQDDNTHEDGDQARRNEEPFRLPTMHEMINETFLGGVIARPNPNRIVHRGRLRFLRKEEALLYGFMRGLIEGFLDAMYFIGSFFLSLLPMWHPRPGPEFPCQFSDFIDAIINDDLEVATDILHKRPDFVRMRDENGWEPIHEAVRAGHIDCIQFLINNSADVNSRTGADHNGGSVLWWALRYYDNDSALVVFLREKGAISVAPGEFNESEPT